jgi:hypothetical protein
LRENPGLAQETGIAARIKETLINSVLRANRCVAVVLKPLRTLSTCGLCAPRALRFIPQNEFLSISLRHVGWGERSEPQHFGKFAGVRFTHPSLRTLYRKLKHHP